MTEEELIQYSEEWRQGYSDVMTCKDIEMSKEEKASKSSEWKEGARYAIQHPLGRVVVPM